MTTKNINERMDALDESFTVEEKEVSPETKGANQEETPPEKDATIEELIVEDTSVTDKTGAEKETPVEDVSDEDLLKALSKDDSADENNDEDPFALFDEVKALAATNKWDDEKLNRLLGFKDAIKSYAEELDARETKAARIMATAEAEFAEVLAKVGLTPAIFEARNWPTQVADAFEKKFSKSTGIKEVVEDEDEDEELLDIPMTRREVKKYLEKQRRSATPVTTTPTEKSPLEIRLDKLEAEKAVQGQITEINAAFTHYWMRDPVIKKIIEARPKLEAAFRAKAFSELGTNFPELLGKDGTGQVIRRKIRDFGIFVQTRLSATPTKKEPTKEKIPPLKGGKPSVGDVVHVKKPQLVKEEGGRTKKMSTLDALDEFDTEFDQSLGITRR